MTNILKYITLSILLIAILIMVLSCVSTISEDDYIMVLNELSETKDQVDALQDELAANEVLKAQYKNHYEELSEKFEELKIKNDYCASEIEVMESLYEEMKAEYKEMKRQNDLCVIEIEYINSLYEDLKRKYDELAGE